MRTFIIIIILLALVAIVAVVASNDAPARIAMMFGDQCAAIISS